MRRLTLWAATTALIATLAGCGAAPGDPNAPGNAAGDKVLSISAIPDQDPQKLQRLYGTVSEYLGARLGVKVRYVPVTDYTASVTSFRLGDLQLVFFGGLTGVQARHQLPGAVPVAQRDIDAQFRSVFVASSTANLLPVGNVAGLRNLQGHSLTFGSDSSTSGRLMPEYFLDQAGVSLDKLKGKPGYSSSHDATAKLVEAGTYEIGALNAAVWDDRVKNGKIDTTKVREIFRTPTYHDYHWLARPDLDQRFGAGFTKKVTDALLSLKGDDDQQRQILDLFQAKQFIATDVRNYEQIESVARRIGLLR
ncbi:putative selenate ABC transporter substrate-binding protein [Amycolatopsis sp. TNS106]|uniref:putative selenate ABC transporter substrate-binding protein n=1 Tax=Amycolatopsis sp. TNS106 TaxID=2861750 RepID=UPI001C58586C|nr:putative selenate ABC transporter substrate-binding protein [Amycolatopsis sp. TNS106]QXV56964.1 putative selenate ABC transporter substrate-binding protein [Amycolatopsis sp. TNS106]